MIDKIVLYTIEKKSKRQIPMVLICRDSSEKDSSLIQVIFGAVKPHTTRLDLLHFNREPIDTKDYRLLSMDLYLSSKIRHVVFGGLNQEDSWEKATKLADRFIMRVGRMGPNSQNKKSSVKYTKPADTVDNIYSIYSPPVAILITNNNSFEKSLKKGYTSSKKNE